jgi:hypothetical protein
LEISAFGVQQIKKLPENKSLSSSTFEAKEMNLLTGGNDRFLNLERRGSVNVHLN